MDDEFDIEDEEAQELEDVDYADGDESTSNKVMDFIKENKKLVIVAIVVIVLLLLMSLFSSNNGDEEILISAKTLTVTTETSAQLKLTKDGKDLTGVTWRSENPDVASVDSTGTVKGLKVGKATIVGKYKDKEYKCEVTVSGGNGSLKIEKITVSDDGIILMPVGTTYEVPIQVTPSEAVVKSKVFSSSEPSVASIDISTGRMTANALGETTIRVSVNDGEAQTNIKARVINGQIVPGIYVLPTRLSLNEKEITLTEGETKILSFIQEPMNASTDYILWTSADEEIATVYNGELIARKAGNVEISVSSLDLRDTMVVHVLPGEIPVTGINIASETSITMNVGDQSQIIATVEPSNATNQVITYLVDNPTVLSVDSNGTISAFGSGSTIITVSPSSNLDIKRLIYVTVNEPYNPPVDPDDPGGGGTPEKKVGSVVITGTNNAVSTELTGNEVDNTKITLKGSGNVDEIRFCFYNKATSSTCSYSIYTNEFTLPPSKVTNKTTYVIKAVPYYQGKEGQEVIRYVTIKGTGGTATVGYMITSNNLYNNQGTAGSYVKTGDQTITFDIVNGGVSYLKVCTGSNCTPSTKILDNGSYKLTSRGMITVRVSEYNANNELVRGPDTWYVQIHDESQDNKCYCNSNSECRWGKSGDGYTILTYYDYNPCTYYINRGNKGCFLHNGSYTWGSYLADPSNYSYVSTINKREDCGTQPASSRCYCNGNGECIWGVKDSSHTNDVTSIVDETSCKQYISRGNKGCFRVNSTSKYEWGSLLGISGYVLFPTYTSSTTCPFELELRNTSNVAVANEVGMLTNKQEQLYLYVNGTKKTSNVTWSSSKTSVATVSSGLIKTVGVGTTRITATYNGKSIHIDLTVSSSSVTVGTITITGNGLTTTKPTTSSSSVSATTIKATKSGNVNKIKYCHTTGSSCTPNTEVSIGSSEVTILSNFSTSGIHTFIFEPYYNNTAGTKLTRYVRIVPPKTDPVCPILSSTTATYDGKDHYIILSGNSSGGTIKYKEGENGSWSTTNIGRKSVGTSKIYVKMFGDSSHNDKDCGYATVTITSVVPSVNCTVGSYYDSRSSKCLKCPSGYNYTVHGDVTESVITDKMLSGSSGNFKSKYSYLYSGNNYWGILQYQHATSISQCAIEVEKGYALQFTGYSGTSSTPFACTKGFYADETRYVKYGSSSTCKACPSGTTTTYQGSKSINDCK